MNNGERIVARLQEAGVRFHEGVPNGTHYCCRGHDPRTSLVVIERKGRRSTKNEMIRWQLWEDGELTASGLEVILAEKAEVLARTRCLVMAGNDRDFDAELMSLDDFGRRRQLGLGCKPLTSHWRGPVDPLAGREILYRRRNGDRYRALIVESRYVPEGCQTLEDVQASGTDPQIVFRPYTDRGTEVSVARLSEVEVGDRLV